MKSFYPASLLVATALSLTLLVPHPALADDDTAALRAEIKALEARLDQMEKREKIQQAAAKKAVVQTAAATATATKTPATTASLSQRLAVVEQNQATAAATTANVKFTPGYGMTVTSPDKQAALHITGYVQADDRTFAAPNKSGNTDTFIIRSARPVIEAKLTDYFDSRLAIDFGKGTTTLLDAYGDIHPMPGTNYINLRAGEFKVPVGIERWQSESDVLFVERGQTTNLVPYRDIGAMFYGQPLPGQIEYQLGVTNGASDLQANTGDPASNQDKDIVGRLFVHPLAWSGVEALKGLGVGAGGTYGVHQGTPTAGASDLTAGYVSIGQRTYFNYRTTGANLPYADGAQWRLNPQAMYYNGPVGLIGEYVFNDQELKSGTNVGRFGNKAWEGIAEWVLTGEDAKFDGVTPTHNFDPQAGQWGAFELVGRVSQLDVDRRIFVSSIFANPATNSRSALETTLGGTWYFNRAVKFNLDLSRTAFDGGVAGNGNHHDEEVVLSRAQFRF